jgi:membrane dipeptidase
MIEGGLDASFFIVYVGQPNLKDTPDALTSAGYRRAYQAAIAKFDAVHRLTEQIAPDQIQLALTSADVRRINASGKKVALIGVENGYPIGEDIHRVQEFYDRGGHICRWRTTATTSCRTRTPASAFTNGETASRHLARKCSPK